MKKKRNAVILWKKRNNYGKNVMVGTSVGTMKITLLYQGFSLYQGKKTIKSWDQQNYLVITGFCYIRPLYNEVPLYYFIT